MTVACGRMNHISGIWLPYMDEALFLLAVSNLLIDTSPCAVLAFNDNSLRNLSHCISNQIFTYVISSLLEFS